MTRKISVAVTVLVVILLIVFFALPVAPQLPVPRFLLPVIAPFFDFGSENWGFFDRIPYILLGGMALLAALGLGTSVLLFQTMLRNLFYRTAFYESGLGGKYLNCWEQLFFSLFTGLAAWSVGWVVLALCGLGNSPVFTGVITVFFAIIALLIWGQRVRLSHFSLPAVNSDPILWCLRGILVLFALIYLCGALVPTCEYDMLEYHIQSAREIYDSGRLTFAAHNVYMNMPLGTEMFYLWGLNLFPGLGTWSDYAAVMTGKVIVAGFALLTALGVGLFVFRITQSKRPAHIGAIVYLSFPTNFYLFANGLNDGVLGCCVLVFLFALYLARFDSRCLYLASIGVGFALSCKYTAVVFVLVPMVALTFPGNFRNRSYKMTMQSIRAMMLVAIFGGVWYLKNFYYTGNPFHPLLYQWFGDSTNSWNVAKNSRWVAAHSPDSFSFGSLFEKGKELFFAEPMSSPFLLVALAAIAVILWRRKHGITLGLALYTVFYLVVWLVWTHRVPRFVAPVYPVLSVLSAVAFWSIFSCKKDDGKTVAFPNITTVGIILILGFSLLYSIATVSLLQRDWFTPLTEIARQPERYGCWAIALNSNEISGYEKRINSHPGEKIPHLLPVGEAKAFAYEVPILYNTCWDDSPLINLLEGCVIYNQTGTRVVEITSPDLIKERLAQSQITAILVNYSELARFRSPGNYGYSSEPITDSLFKLLEKSGVIAPWKCDNYDQFDDYSKTAFIYYRVLP